MSELVPLGRGHSWQNRLTRGNMIRPIGRKNLLVDAFPYVTGANWTEINGAIVVELSDGGLSITNDGAAPPGAVVQGVPTVIGESYTCKVQALPNNSVLAVGSTQGDENLLSVTGFGQLEGRFVAVGTTSFFKLSCNNTATATRNFFKPSMRRVVP